MALPKLSAVEKRERKDRAHEWKGFRKARLFTQIRLADVLGISRRTVQQIEAGKVAPHPSTLGKFIGLKEKHKVHRDV